MAVDLVLLRTAALEARDRARERLEPLWQKLQHVPAAQRKMAGVIGVLLVINVILLARSPATSSPHAPAAENTASHRARRQVDSTNLSNEPYGVTYVRWGRKTCPPEAGLVYEGVAGGSWYSHTGGGANYVCLPRSPIYESGGSPTHSWAVMYGAEYEFIDGLAGTGLHITDGNVPCAVCQSVQRTSLLMVPARNICYPGWHLEYKGFLVSERDIHASQKVFECLDHDLEFSESGYRNENGALMYGVRSKCGSLPCPEYKENGFLTCAVCTK